MFKFNQQLDVGAEGEALFLTMYPWLNKADGIKYDFERDGKTVELKTDTYSMLKTPNFFMEKFSDKNRATVGGPWRAAKDNVDFFVYMFLQEKKCFWFRSKELTEFLDKHCANKRTIDVPNKTWTTCGYLVNRKDVEHLVIR